MQQSSRETVLTQVLYAAEGSPATKTESPTPATTLFDLVRSSVEAGEKKPSSSLDAFLSETNVGQALQLWLGSLDNLSLADIARKLNRDVATIDAMVNEQLNAIMHHRSFQKLEASWRGLYYLWSKSIDEGESGIKIKVLSVGWRELERDFEKAIEFDQSQLFRKVYENEFGTAGGEPFGLLLGDYEIHPRPTPDHPHNDLEILTAISQVAAAAFCPFISATDPAMFGIDDFSTLENRLDHAKTFDQTEYVKWRAFRDTEDARFVGLVLPRVLMRNPYKDDGTRLDGFAFRENVDGPDFSKYLWGSAAYAFGAVLVRAFSQAGWLADIRGVRRGIDGGGLVTGLPVHSFSTDRQGVATKSSTDVTITDELEKLLSDLGFIPLSDCRDTEFSAFYSNQSAQKPKTYDRQAATVNAKISSMLQYMLCVSRFAHYIKVLGRDKIGAYSEPEDLERMLQNWIVKYVTDDREASPEVKCRFPLREARVEIREQPGRPGAYDCVMQLAPHYELDEISASVRINTQLAPSRNT